MWLLQQHRSLVHNMKACGTYARDGYHITAFNQNLCGENDWHVYPQKHPAGLQPTRHPGQGRVGEQEAGGQIMKLGVVSMLPRGRSV